jgi:hypothetical protein
MGWERALPGLSSSDEIGGGIGIGSGLGNAGNGSGGSKRKTGAEHSVEPL